MVKMFSLMLDINVLEVRFFFFTTAFFSFFLPLFQNSSGTHGIVAIKA